MTGKITISLLTLLACAAFISIPVKADTATANAQIPIFRLMYHADEAEAIVANNKSILSDCRKNKASAAEITLAQTAVNDAQNLLNTINTMIERNRILIAAAPAGVVNPSSFAVNSLSVQGAWNDYYTRAKVGHALIWPTGPKAKANPLACSPFCMY